MSKSIRDSGKRDVAGEGQKMGKGYNDMRHYYLSHVRRSIGTICSSLENDRR